MVQSAIHTNRDRPKRPYMKIREMNIVVEDLAVPAGASLLSLGVVCKVRGSVADCSALLRKPPYYTRPPQYFVQFTIVCAQFTGLVRPPLRRHTSSKAAAHHVVLSYTAVPRSAFPLSDSTSQQYPTWPCTCLGTAFCIPFSTVTAQATLERTGITHVQSLGLVG
jgi:hypothetical protein